MAEEQVFRFLALRQAVDKTRKDPFKRKLVSYSVNSDGPQLGREIFSLPVSERTQTKINKIAHQYR